MSALCFLHGLCSLPQSVTPSRLYSNKRTTPLLSLAWQAHAHLLMAASIQASNPLALKIQLALSLLQALPLEIRTQFGYTAGNRSRRRIAQREWYSRLTLERASLPRSRRLQRQLVARAMPLQLPHRLQLTQHLPHPLRPLPLAPRPQLTTRSWWAMEDR